MKAVAVVICPRCGTPRAIYTKCVSCRSEYNRHYAASHRERRRERQRAMYAADPERSSERNRAQYVRHREKRLAAVRAYARANRAIVLASRRASWAKNRSKHRDYRQAHLAEHREHEATRNARKRGAGGSHTAQAWAEKCALFAGCCAYCGESRPLTRDHNVPISRGGSDDISNIVPACAACNRRKSTMTSREYLEVA